MSYLKGRDLLQRRDELREFIDCRFEKEDEEYRNQIYEWLDNNQYFVDNELFDFFCSTAQNLAAIKILGCSGEKIIEAKHELEKSAQIYVDRVIENSQQAEREFQLLKANLDSVKDRVDGLAVCQDELKEKIIDLLEKLKVEQKNLDEISSGLIDSVSILLAKQKKMLSQTSPSSKFVYNSVVTIIALFGWLAATLILLI